VPLVLNAVGPEIVCASQCGLGFEIRDLGFVKAGACVGLRVSVAVCMDCVRVRP